jgi:hypothetical protein
MSHQDGRECWGLRWLRLPQRLTKDGNVSEIHRLPPVNYKKRCSLLVRQNGIFGLFRCHCRLLPYAFLKRVRAIIGGEIDALLCGFWCARIE